MTSLLDAAATATALAGRPASTAGLSWRTRPAVEQASATIGDRTAVRVGLLAGPLRAVRILARVVDADLASWAGTAVEQGAAAVRGRTALRVLRLAGGLRALSGRWSAAEARATAAADLSGRGAGTAVDEAAAAIADLPALLTAGRLRADRTAGS